ncbi:hypothetical protein [Streptomyces sp. NPDC000229]|uniref:hypothetical protein n=1 Tax=Streptomyces sp. NPDC000229 TaxID=3154247 RepID=UPI0033301865
MTDNTTDHAPSESGRLPNRAPHHAPSESGRLPNRAPHDAHRAPTAGPARR